MGNGSRGHVSGGEGVNSSPAEEAFATGVPQLPPAADHMPVDNYDIAVLVSSDRDFVPVAEFLETRGVKVIHGAFPPMGSQLTARCWGSVNVPRLREKFRFTRAARGGT